MYNGIIETIGKVHQLQIVNNHLNFMIEPQINFDGLLVGDNIAINGVCLTVTKVIGQYFCVTAVPHTLTLTNLHMLTVDSYVNLERSVKMDARVEGHTVQGHVDGTGIVESISDDGVDSLNVKIKVPANISKYIVNKGCIALDGMSTTVCQINDDHLIVTFIPYSRAKTIINYYRPSTLINIEVDIFAKYIEKLMRSYHYA